LFSAALDDSISPAAARANAAMKSNESIGFIQIDDDITLRRMVARNSRPKGIILLLHGFPETLHAWEGVSRALADEFKVHAFDWPGYGLSSRPTVDRFAYAPSDYARVLKGYITRAGIDSSKLTIYATDIGALPALLLAIDEPEIARQIIVGDFAPFDRPQYMHERLQSLKVRPTSDVVSAQMNGARDDTLSNAFRRGLPSEAQFELSPAFANDMRRGWRHGSITSADAFYHYYSYFTRDQNHFEANIARFKTPLKVVWGEIDPYINRDMGTELANRLKATLTLLSGIGHYPHLQDPTRTVAEIRAAAS
jgi:pimeloyl-ACP methyl ester carboxylesterase